MSDILFITCYECGRNRLPTMRQCRCGSVLVKQYGLKDDAQATPKPKRKKLQPTPASAKPTGKGEFIESFLHRSNEK